MEPISRAGKTFFLCSTICFLVSTSAFAHKISPGTKVDMKMIKTKHQSWQHHLASPVHEEMAMLADLCAARLTDEDFCFTKNSAPESIEFRSDDPLIWGIRWNDDPNNQTAGERTLDWLFWLTDASLSKQIKITDPLVHRSHFGDLQFLHAMAINGEDPKVTKKNILDWMHFTYDVAIGKINLDVNLESLSNDYAFVKKFTGTSKIYWTPRKLFLNFFDYKDKKPPASWNSVNVPRLALGALLHTIQDSYSASHVQRSHQVNTGKQSSREILSFLDYRAQKSSCHGVEDLEPDWLNQVQYETRDGPVYQSAWIIRRANINADWIDGKVSEYLSSTIFPLASSYSKAHGGGYATCK
jgi:hypothetical protein